MLGLENIANLDQLPSTGATVIIGVTKLGDGSGAPVRLLGLIGGVPGSCVSGFDRHLMNTFCLIMATLIYVIFTTIIYIYHIVL